MTLEELKKRVSSIKKTGVIVSPTKSADGRGNDYHDASTGEFTSKDAAGSASAKPEEEADFSNIKNWFARKKEVYKAPTMNNFVLHREERLAKRMRGLTEEQKRNQEILRPYVQKVLDNSNFTIGISFKNLLSVLKDGEYKNQFATGTSRGLLSSHRRFNVSRSFFGHGLSDMALGVELEKNGFMQSKRIDKFFEERSGSVYSGYSASQYQDECKISIILKKKELADRTTYCFGDSLNQESDGRGGILPQKYTMPWDIGTVPGYKEGRILNHLEESRRSLEEGAYLPCAMGEEFSGDGSFIECQYHGPLKCDLMSGVIIGNRNAFHNLGEERQKELLSILKERNMRALINKGDNKTLEVVKLDESGNIYYTTYESEEIGDD